MTIIRGDCFLLRPLRLSDLEGYWETMQDADTAKGFTSVPKDKFEAKAELEDYLKKMKDGLTEVFTIELDRNYAGNVRLDRQDWNAESHEGRVHLWTHPAYRGRGLSTKALIALVNYAFEVRHDEVLYAQCKAANQAVVRVLQKAGFEKKENRIVEGAEKIWWVLRHRNARKF